VVSREQLLRPPYGVVFYPPEGWIDQSCYRFVEPLVQREFVLDARPWKALEAVTQLESVRSSLAAAKPSLITSHPHSVFDIHGFHINLDGDDTRPGFRMFTLVSEDRVWGLRVVGAIAEQDLDEWLAAFTVPSRIDSSQRRYWLALDIAIEVRPNWQPPQQFSYGAPGALLALQWQLGTEFGEVDASPLIDESDMIGSAPASAYIVSYEVTKLQRVLVPGRLGLGAHCFVAQALCATRALSGEPSRDADVTNVRLCCVADLRQQPDAPELWRDVFAITEAHGF
jgi:hypothetical protein